MSNYEELRDNPPESVVDMDEHEMYWSILKDITNNGVQLQYHDRHSLGELAVSICEMNRLRHELKENGESKEVQGDRNKITKKNPAREALEKLRPAVLRLMKEFQMTPSSRGKTFGPQTGAGKPDDGFDIV